MDPLYLMTDSLKPSFLTHFLQIHCIGLFGPKFIYDSNCVLTLIMNAFQHRALPSPPFFFLVEKIEHLASEYL